MTEAEARDLFILSNVIGRPDSPRLAAMAYDDLVEIFGQPGAGYDPVKVFRAYQSTVWQKGWREFKEVEARGKDALIAEGWL
ncbi:MAG: hypothetical protein ABW128_15545 [Rhizorhabdus sp.]